MTEEIINPMSLKRISWGAIFAGTVVALMVSLILGLAGVAVGAATIHPQTEANPMHGIGIGAAIWWFVLMIISLFVGGWVAGRLAGVPRRVDAMLHGVITWGFVTLIALFAAGSALGGILSGTANILAGGLSSAAHIFQTSQQANEPAGAQGKNDVLNSAKQEAKSMLRQTGKPELQPQALKSETTQAVHTATSGTAAAAENPNQAGQILDNTLDKLYSQSKAVVSQADRQAAVNVVMAQTGKNQQEASQIVDGWIQKFQQAQVEAEHAGAEVKQNARAVGEAVAQGTAKTAAWGLLALVLGGIAALLGGIAGMPRDILRRA